MLNNKRVQINKMKASINEGIIYEIEIIFKSKVFSST